MRCKPRLTCNRGLPLNGFLNNRVHGSVIFLQRPLLGFISRKTSFVVVVVVVVLFLFFVFFFWGGGGGGTRIIHRSFVRSSLFTCVKAIRREITILE